MKLFFLGFLFGLLLHFFFLLFFGLFTAGGLVLLGSLLDFRADIQDFSALIVPAEWAGRMRTDIPFTVTADRESEGF